LGFRGVQPRGEGTMEKTRKQTKHWKKTKQNKIQRFYGLRGAQPRVSECCCSTIVTDPMEG